MVGHHADTHASDDCIEIFFNRWDEMGVVIGDFAEGFFKKLGVERVFFVINDYG